MVFEPGDQFVDIDSEEYTKESKFSYEQILLKQIQRCVDNLSKERIGGQVIDKLVKGVITKVYIPDVREEIINSVHTLNSLMLPFIKDSASTKLTELKEGKDKKIKDLGEAEIKLPGKKESKVKEISYIPTNHPIFQKRKEIEADYSVELFAVLVMAYHKIKKELEALSYE